MLRQLICKDAKERLSAEQALEQSWSKQKASEKSGPRTIAYRNHIGDMILIAIDIAYRKYIL